MHFKYKKFWYFSFQRNSPHISRPSTATSVQSNLHNRSPKSIQAVSGVTTTATNIDDDDGEEIRLNGMLDRKKRNSFWLSHACLSFYFFSECINIIRLRMRQFIFCAYFNVLLWQMSFEWLMFTSYKSIGTF